MNYKLLAGLFAVLMVTPVVAQLTPEVVVGNMAELATGEGVVISKYTVSQDSIKSFSVGGSFNYNSYLIIWVTTSTPGQANHIINYDCYSFTGTFNSSTLSTVDLGGGTSPASMWTFQGVSGWSIPVKQGDDRDRQWYISCNIENLGATSDVYIMAYPEINPANLYAFPDSKMNTLLTRIIHYNETTDSYEGTLPSIYTLIELGLIVAGASLLIFVFVFMWKFFAYIVSRVRRREDTQ